MPKKVNTLADWKASYEPDIVIPNKIKAALASLLKESEEGWESEADFIKRAKISNTQIGAYRSKFEKHIALGRESGKSEKRFWFASAKVAAKARGE